jgi:hypothetical protein
MWNRIIAWILVTTVILLPSSRKKSGSWDDTKKLSHLVSNDEGEPEPLVSLL